VLPDTAASRKLALLVNPAAAGGKALAAVQPATEELDRLQAAYRVVETSSGDHAKREALGAAGNGETVVAIGGDGLVGTLAGAIQGTAAPLAIVPAGRGNDFARVLGIPTDPAEAARLAATGDTKLLDVGEVDGKSFVGIASVGFDSDANRIANDAKLVRGNLVYAYAALRALIGWKPARFETVIDGETHVTTGYSVGVCNSKAYGGGMYAAPQAELDDGLLDIVLCADVPKRRFLFRIMPKVFKGTHLQEPNITAFTGAVIEVRADRPFTMYADGDPLADLPATVRIRPRALHVVVPGD
jgi:YegS/Rv2252/BmrU family lipid kinase